MTNKINDREVYMKGIETSYYYEGYTTFKTEDLKKVQSMDIFNYIIANSDLHDDNYGLLF